LIHEDTVILTGSLRVCALAWMLVVAGCVSDTAAQGCVWWDPGSTTVGSYSAITSQQRAEWIACGTAGVSSVGIGLINAAVPGWYNTLEDWKKAEAGLPARFGHREADVTVSNGVEAGLGAIWGEEPRYVPMGRADRASVASRLGYALLTVVAAERRDGHLAPAWGRYAGNLASSALDAFWLPADLTGWQHAAVRSTEAMLIGRSVANLWDEFRPDLLAVTARIFRRPR
jgi:hypothetical protein